MALETSKKFGIFIYFYMFFIQMGDNQGKKVGKPQHRIEWPPERMEIFRQILSSNLNLLEEGEENSDREDLTFETIRSKMNNVVSGELLYIYRLIVYQYY